MSVMLQYGIIAYLLWAIGGGAFYFTFKPNISILEMFRSIYELTLWISLPILVAVMVLNEWYLLPFAGVVMLIFIGIYTPYLIPRQPKINHDMPQIRVMTFNLNMTSKGIVDAIRSTHADVVTLQELSQDSAATVQQLSDIYPYMALHPQKVDYVGQGILSKYPILKDEYWEYPEVENTLGHQRVEIDFNGMSIVIYNTHPWPPLEWETGYDDASHRIVLENIAQRTFAEELPLILAGDFNMTPNFEEYDLFASQFTDSYWVAGDGLGFTYPTHTKLIPSFFRLDYIWHSKHFQSVSAQVWHNHGESDHAPVVSTLALKAHTAILSLNTHTMKASLAATW